MDKKDRIGMTNVYGTKAVSLWGDQGWDIVSPAPDKDAGGIDNLWRNLAWPYRGVNIISDKLASIPFDIMNGKAVVDNSSDYKNKLGFLPNPKNLIWLLGASLTLNGKGYLFSDNAGKIRKSLRYIVPNSVVFDVSRKEVANAAKVGKIILTRTVDGSSKDFIGGEDIIYFWLPDPGIELGPPNSSPMRAALSAAGVLFNVDQYVKAYWEHGAIRAMVFAIKGNPPEQQKLDLLSWYRNMIAGVRNAFNAATINADALTTQMVGDGLEGLQDTNLTAEKREEISTAFGIPQTILFSSSASGLGGGGVSDGDRIKLYEDTIIPRAEFLEETFNNQVFQGTNYKLVFKPRELPIFEKDRQSMSQALVSLSTYFGGIGSLPPQIGFDILGYPIDEKIKAQLDKWASDKAKAAPVVEPTSVKPDPNKSDQTKPEPTLAQKAKQEDLKKWKRKALKKVGQAVAFDSENIPHKLYAAILDGLKACQTEDQVKALFDEAVSEPKSDTLLLAEAINLLAEKNAV